MITDLFNRYIWLVDTIYSAGTITREEINQKWEHSRYNPGHEKEIPERTFHRDRAAVSILFNIDLEFDRHKGIYYLGNNSDVQQNGLRNWMLSSFAVKQMIDESDSLQDRILFESIPEGQQYLSIFVTAMREKTRARITHKSFGSKAKYSTLFSPFCLKVFKHRWYVAGISDKYPNEIRVYALDRLKEVKNTDIPFDLPAGFSAQELFQYSYGVYQGIDPVKILIKIRKTSVPFIRSVPLHTSQKEIETTEKYSIFSYYIAPTMDFKLELRTLGADAEILEPESFRKEFIQDIKELISTYSIS